MKKMSKRILSLLLCFALLLSYFPAIAVQAAAPDSLIANLDFSQIKDGKVVDISGNGNDATIHGKVDVCGGLGIFEGGYLQLPDNFMSDLDAITVAGWMNFDENITNNKSRMNSRLFDFGNDTNNFFQFCPNNAWGQQVAEVKVGGSTVEYKLGDKTSKPWTGFTFAQPGTWAHVAVTFGDGYVQVYMDGELVQSGETVHTPKSIGTTTKNYIGKAQFDADPAFPGMMENVQIYSTVLSQEEIAAVMNAENQTADAQTVKQIRGALNALDLGDLSDVSTDLTLPSGSNGVTYTWSSGNPELLSNDGKIKEGLIGKHEVTLNVTAGVAGSDVTATKEFVVTLMGMSDADIVAYDTENLLLSTLIESSYLPSTGKKGSTVVWSSSDPAVLKDGKILRPASGEGNATATLTATISYGEASATKVFEDRLIMEEYVAYLLSFFDGSGPNGIYFAISYDGLHWYPLNNNKPVMTATLDNKNTRDPMIYRQPDGQFRMIATHGWDHSDVYVWDAGDLTGFTGERLLNVTSKVRAWAPEIMYDVASGKYVIVYSESADDSVANCWATYTTDFTDEGTLASEKDIPLITSDKVLGIDWSFVSHNGKRAALHRCHHPGRIPPVY